MRGIDCASCGSAHGILVSWARCRHARRSAPASSPLWATASHISHRGADLFPSVPGKSLPPGEDPGVAPWAAKDARLSTGYAPDGVWPTASAQAGLRDRHRKFSPTVPAFRTPSGLRPPSPLRGEGETCRVHFLAGKQKCWYAPKHAQQTTRPQFPPVRGQPSAIHMKTTIEEFSFGPRSPVTH